ncbi:hypothetical protein Btru_069021 [Bulinus truncatus]|nr:hypothetical protein Btru_069021 [Bulinus truncatus]
MILFQVSNPPVPYLVEIPDGQKLCQQIGIFGQPKCGSRGFIVNFMSGPNVDSDDIELQVKVDFDPCNSTSSVVAQSRRCGQWQSAGPFFSNNSPFGQNCRFTVRFVPNNGEYVVEVNNHPIGAFKNINLCRITHLYIAGELTLERVYT